MKFSEKLQYKVRNYLYDRERSKSNHQMGKKRVDAENTKGIAQIGKVFEEMDDYLGEIFENLPHKKDSKRKN